MTDPTVSGAVPTLVQRRYSRTFRARLTRALTPPLPLVHNPAERQFQPSLGRHNLYIGGAGCQVPGYINLDLFAAPGVDVRARAEQLPFPDSIFTRIECDAVLEHVDDPAPIMAELARVSAPGGFVHLVTPFCHPFHEYPRDFRRFSLDGLRQLADSHWDVVGGGWRTGPTATVLVFLLEYIKLWMPNRPLRAVAHGVFGWLLFPFRYLDLILYRKLDHGRLGNHCYVWLRRRS